MIFPCWRPGDSQNFSELYVPRHLFPSRSQLVLVSPLISEDYDMLAALRMSGYHLLVVSPDPVSFEADGMAETRTNLLARRIVQLQRECIAPPSARCRDSCGGLGYLPAFREDRQT